MTVMVKICLSSPGHLSTNPRLVKEALALKSAGFEVAVVHGSFSAWGAAVDHAIAAEIGHTRAVPFGPVQAPWGTYLRQTLVRRVARTLAGVGTVARPLFEPAHSPIVADLVRETMRIRADLYVAHYVSALPAAAQAAKRHGALYAFDAEDFHLGDLPDAPEYALEKRIIRAIEARYLPGAAYVTAASPMIAEAYAETYNIPLPTTVLNVFPKQNAPAGPTPRGTAEPGPSLYWFSQTIGPGRGIETAIEAISLSKSRPHLYLRGMSSIDYVKHLRSLAANYSISEGLHFIEPAFPDELERLGSEYDLGFIGELSHTLNRQIALTNKFFSYLMSGIPIIASDVPAHRRIAPEIGLAMTLFPTGVASALAGAIDGFLLNPERLKAARLHAWNLAQSKFNWEFESVKLQRLVRETLDSRTE